MLYDCGGRPTLNFSRRILTGAVLAPRSFGIPGLTEKQAEAIDAVHFAAKDHQVKVSTENGDIRFVNNVGLLHGREAFTDEHNPEYSKRHLIRLWLHNPMMLGKLPLDLQLAWDRVFDDKERVERWNAEPVMDEHGLPLERFSPQPMCD